MCLSSVVSTKNWLNKYLLFALISLFLSFILFSLFGFCSSNGREARNRAEKHRRDKLNGSIQELSMMVPHVAESPRRVDKTAVLRFSAHGLRLNYGEWYFHKWKETTILRDLHMIRWPQFEKIFGAYINMPVHFTIEWKLNGKWTHIFIFISFCSHSVRQGQRIVWI